LMAPDLSSVYVVVMLPTQIRLTSHTHTHTRTDTHTHTQTHTPPHSHHLSSCSPTRSETQSLPFYVGLYKMAEQNRNISIVISKSRNDSASVLWHPEQHSSVR